MFNNYNQEEQKKKHLNKPLQCTVHVYKIKCKFYPLKEWN